MTTIRLMTPDDWPRVRDLRLKALADAPEVFGSTLEGEHAFGEPDWRARLSNAATFLATSAQGDVGMVTALTVEQPGTGLLVGMWVAPPSRGEGVAQQLIGEVIGWARATGLARLILDVGDTNPAAVRLYEGLGFRPTGKTGTLPPPRIHVLQHERELILASSPEPGVQQA